MSIKNTTIFDLNLFSGSSELIRQEFGSYYEDVDGQGDIDYKQFSLDNSRPIESIVSYGAGSNTDFILPRFIYPNRILSKQDSGIRTDDEWKKFIIGGDFADVVYSGIYNNLIYTDHANKTPFPYLPRETINTTLESSLSLTTEYFNRYSRYQAKAFTAVSELMIPNFYTLDPDLNLLSPDADTESTVASERYLNMIEYLTNTYPNEDTIMDENMQNIFVIDPATDLESYNAQRNDTTDLLLSGKFDSDLEKTYSLLPYGNKFVVEEDMTNVFKTETYSGNTLFRTLMKQNDFQIKFLKMLKEIFQQETDLETQNASFIINLDQREETGVETTTTQAVKLIDLPTMILNSFKNPVSQNSNITVINSSSYQSQIDYAFDESGIYRYENTQKSLEILNTFMDKIKDLFLAHQEEVLNLDSFLNLAGTFGKKYNETIAFRIEKIGGPPSGDLSTQNTIQNIWFFNSKEAFTYFDTQVKYNTEYTYKIYKYVIVQGYKYQNSDIRVTRQLATETDAEGNTVYCLQFYDPFTGEGVPQISSNESLLSSYEHNQELRQQIADANEVIDFHTSEINQTLRDYNILRIGLTSPMRVLSILGRRLTPIEVDLINQIYPLGTNPSNDNEERLRALKRFYDILESSTAPTDEELEEANLGAIGEDVRTALLDQNFYYDVTYLGGLLTRFFSAFIDYLDQFNQEYLSVFFPRYEQDALRIEEQQGIIRELEAQLSPFENRFDDNTRTFSTTPYIAEFNTTIEPSIKILEIPIEQKSMRIIDHPPNDFTVTPHHLLDQSNRLAFYMKYDTFSKNEVTYPYPLNEQDSINKNAYLTGHEFVASSFIAQETPTPVSQIEVFRIQNKPTSYEDFVGASRKIINLRQPNGDIASDHLFVERVRENIKYYYVFRGLNENGVGGQLSPVFEAELVNDGGYVYGLFNQLSEEDLAVKAPKEPLLAFKKLINIVPNIQHLELDTSSVDFGNSSLDEISGITLGSSNVSDPLFNSDLNRYFKIRLTSKKTGRKIDINIGFKKEVRK